MALSRLAILVSCLALAAARPAWSQQQEPNPDTLARYVIAEAGVALDPETTGAFAGEYGERMGNHAMAYINYAYYDNLMSAEMRSNLVAAADVLTGVTGTTYTFTGRDRGLAFTGGAKFLLSSGGVRPYVGVGVGAINLRRSITEGSLGDVTTSFALDSGLTDGVVSAGQTSSTKPLAEGIIGVHLLSGRTFIDVSYRYRKVFHTDFVKFSQVTVGAGVGFW